MTLFMLRLLFPPKCVLCRNLLTKEETDLCHHCRIQAPEISYEKRNIPFIAQWTAIWYYKDDVRKSIHRFKFGNAQRYAGAYARQLAIKLQQTDYLDKCDVITWVPISFRRRMKRGYDQSKLLAKELEIALDMECVYTLKKIRHTAPQSSLKDAATRRANILGAYRLLDKHLVAGKRILLLDDVLTTGATASECAKTLLTAGAKEVYFAAVAAASHDKK